MPLILHKVAPLFVYPLTESILLVLASVVCRRKTLAMAGIVLLAVCSTASAPKRD